MSCISAHDPQLARLADAIAQRVGQQRFHVWFNNSTRLDLKHDGLEIAVPNDFISEWIGKHFTRPIQEAAHEVLGCPLAVRFNVVPQLFEVDGGADAGDGDDRGDVPGGRADGRPPARSAASGTSPRRRRVARRRPLGPTSRALPAAGGRGGRPARSPSSASVARRPPRLGGGHRRASPGPSSATTSTRFVVGAEQPARLQRRHLRRRVPRRPVQPAVHPRHVRPGQDPPAPRPVQASSSSTTRPSGGCISPAKSSPTIPHRLRANKVDAFRRKMRDLDLLVIDDVHFLGGKKATQEEFLHTFNAIEAMGKQVVMASDEHPKLIEEFGEIADQPLRQRHGRPRSTRRTTRRGARSCGRSPCAVGLTLGDEVVDWVARRVTQNVRELEGAITRIAAHVRADRPARRRRDWPRKPSATSTASSSPR